MISKRTRRRGYFFGNIKNGKMGLNHAGCMIERWYHKIGNKLSDKICHEMVVTPNYSHGIIENHKYGAIIGRVMDWFKTMTTNKYITGVKKYDWRRFDSKLWKQNYYDYIIQNDPEYLLISEYIINNPIKWGNDRFF